MKFLHLADLHIGKRVCEYSMLEDQREILRQCCRLAAEQRVNAVLIAGDVYDKPMPSGEATVVLDEFLCGLQAEKIPVFCISGNHDSAERLQFCSSLLRQSGVYIEGSFSGAVRYEDLRCGTEEIRIHLLPFLRPAAAALALNQEIQSYQQAVEAALATCRMGDGKNILLAHQFVTGGSIQPEMGGSEILSVGGSEQVDASLFAAFDYVALGHIHRAQKISSERIRYAGSPLKYSLSELHHQKTALLVELNGEACVIQALPLKPLHEMRQIKGELKELIRYAEPSEDYVYAVVTDREPVYDALGQLKACYPNLMAIDFASESTPQTASQTAAEITEEKTPRRLFDEFYMSRNGEEPTAQEAEILNRLFEEVRLK